LGFSGYGLWVRFVEKLIEKQNIKNFLGEQGENESFFIALYLAL